MREIRTALWIVRRYLLSRSHGYATFINWVSFFGLVLGVMILTVVLSIMNGFDREMTGRILSAVPHGFFEFDGDPPIADLTRIEGVSSVTPLFQGEAMATRHGGVAFVALAGIDEAGARAMPRVLSGQALENLFSSRGSIILGASLARDLRLSVGDSVRLVFPVPSNVGVRPRIELFTLAGIFELRAQPDAALGIVRRQDIVARGLAGAGLDGWRLQLSDPLDAPRLAESIRRLLGGATSIRFWTEDYGELFRAVRIEKAIMFALLALIVAVASLNIVSGQAMLVNDKRGDIAMLATMGASRHLIVGVFFMQGFAVAVLGVAAGLALGIGVAANADAVVSFFEGLVGASVIEGTYFDRIHSYLVLPDLMAVVGVSLGLSAAAVLRPAFKAAAENPAEALHAA
ncbi:MAG: FtsX-like permease family protein [Gammaproteobacteria bacterium]|nr:FtsX-like permease family protein [Gammaproteobacteria bacterium]MYF29176.1 FtsX-like permease family protein [Gammaproteobacteria bacterium]MYK48239.1 FtsX-like permease family protein [Gammaproteobacteria bacterium]